MGTGKGVVVGVSIAGEADVALVDRRGTILRRSTVKTLWGRTIAATFEPYLRAIEDLLAYARDERLHVRGIGISLPGTLHEDGRRPLAVPILPALNGFPLCDLLETRYALPTRLLVDVDAALLGEYRFGAGKGRAARRLFFLTVNAVVGAAFVVDGEVSRSAGPFVGHISHLPLAASGPRCSCGKRGCINTLISLDALQKMVQRALLRGEETSLARRLLNYSPALSQVIAEEARRGDAVAARIYSDVCRWLGAATTRYASLFEPDLIILGGDIAIASDLLPPSLPAPIQGNTSPVATRIEILPALLGRDAPLLGAALP